MDNKTKISYTVVIGIVCLLLLTCRCMTGKIPKKMALIVDQIELANRDTLTIGQNSDVYYHNVPKDYLIVWREGNHFRWKVNDLYEDSLQYFKINNENPNKFTIKNDTSQRIVMELPTSYGNKLPLTVTGKDVWDAWTGRFAKQKEVMVRHFAANYGLSQDSISRNDSLRMLYLNQMQCHNVRSFFHKEKNLLQMVILDKFTRIIERGNDGQETSHGYVRSDTTADDGEKANHIKVQFYTVSTHCYLDQEPEEGTFQVNGVNYVMKSSVKLTEWGAGHVMITPGQTDKSLLLSFPKPITYVGTVDSLKLRSEKSSGIITLKQNNKSFPNKSDLYLPAFSNAINFDLCNIEFNHKGDSAVVIRDNYKSLNVVENPKTSFLPFSLVPAFKKITLHSGNDLLHARMGYIDQGFFMSYLWLPILVFILLMLVIWLPLSPLKIERAVRNGSHNPEQLKRYRVYLSLLLVIALIYCVCKSMITIKLSYTYPYFEKLTGITPVATAALLLLFFSLTMVLNTTLLHRNVRHRVARRGRQVSQVKQSLPLWFAWGMCALIYAGLYSAFIYIMDTQVSAATIQSYFESETIINKVWKWSDVTSVGVNDTHRSVVYTLLFVEGVVLGLWAVLNAAYYKNNKVKLLPRLQSLVTGWNKWAGWLCDLVGRVFGKMRSSSHSQRLEHAIEKVPDKSDLRLAARRLTRVLAVAALLLVYSVVAWLFHLPGIPKVLMLLLLVVGVAMVVFDFVYDAFVGMLKTLFPSHFLLLIVIVVAGKMMGNFGTAFITVGVVIGLSRALSQTAAELNLKTSRPRYTILTQMFLITIVYTVCAMVGDNGYMTNFLGFAMCMIAFFFIVQRERARNPEASTQARNEEKWMKGTLAVVCLLVLLMPVICSKIFNPENVNYSRLSRRVMLYSNFDDLQKSGYRYSESDAEFMVIMSHYMQGDSLGREDRDPLSNDAHFMHPSVSSGQSPVALNDLSVPIAFFGSYSSFWAHVVYFSLLALLMWIVMFHTLRYLDKYKPCLTRAMQWRLLAMFMWVGTSLYIYFSYIDWVPFTGRLNPGFGVDAVGEALETAFLLAFMGIATSRDKNATNI